MVPIMCASHVGGSFTFPFRISIWKGPMCTIYFNSTTTLISSMVLSSWPPATPSCKVASTPPLRDNNWARHKVAYGVVSWSSSLSLMTLMILPSIQVPSTKGTRLEKADQLGTTKNTISSSYPATSFTCSLMITNPKACMCWPPIPTRSTGWLTSFSNGRIG